MYMYPFHNIDTHIHTDLLIAVDGRVYDSDIHTWIVITTTSTVVPMASAMGSILVHILRLLA